MNNKHYGEKSVKEEKEFYIMTVSCFNSDNINENEDNTTEDNAINNNHKSGNDGSKMGETTQEVKTANDDEANKM